MAKKTNKTSHVLNLITNGEPEMLVEESTAAAPPETAGVKPPEAKPAETKPADAKVTVVHADVENIEVSEEIQRQLLNQLESADTEKTGAEAEAEEEESPKAAEEAETPEEETVEEPKAPAEEEETELQAEAEPVEEKAEAAEEEAGEPEVSYRMVNVMEDLLQRANVQKQMEEYGVCPCSRCRADVYALVLTRLPSKYVVVDHTAANPMLSYYESKFRMRILTEMIKSCMDVRENPRH